MQNNEKRINININIDSFRQTQHIQTEDSKLTVKVQCLLSISLNEPSVTVGLCQRMQLNQF